MHNCPEGIANSRMDGHFQVFQCAGLDAVFGGDVTMRICLVFVEEIGCEVSKVGYSRAVMNRKEVMNREKDGIASY